MLIQRLCPDGRANVAFCGEALGGPPRKSVVSYAFAAHKPHRQPTRSPAAGASGARETPWKRKGLDPSPRQEQV